MNRESYEKAERKARTDVLALLATIDPALGSNSGLQYAHNWYVCTAKPESRRVMAIIDAYETRSSAIYRRRSAEYCRIEVIKERNRYGVNKGLERVRDEAIRDYRRARAEYMTAKRAGSLITA